MSIYRPEDIPDCSITDLVEHWSNARMRTFLATHTVQGTPDADDLLAELAYGARIAEAVTCGRWAAVADLLRTRAVASWTQIGDAMGVTELEAHDGFHGWIAGQVDLRRRTGTIGLTDAGAAELYALSAAVEW